MIDCMDDVTYTIKNANKFKNEILVDRDDPKKLHLDYQVKHRIDDVYVRVVVKFATSSYKEGEIVTAFMPKNFRNRDVPLVLEELESKEE